MSGGNNSNLPSSGSDGGSSDPFSVQPAVDKIQGISTKMFFNSKISLSSQKQHLVPEHISSSSEHHDLSDDSFDDPPYPEHDKPL